MLRPSALWLRACGSIGLMDKGNKIHSEILREVSARYSKHNQGLGAFQQMQRNEILRDEVIHRKFLENDTVLGNSLIDVYAKSGVLAQTQEVLQQLPGRDIVSWDVLIAGYTQHGQYHETWRNLKE